MTMVVAEQMRGGTMEDIFVVKTDITYHVFHYPTHSVVWVAYYGPAQPDMPPTIEMPSATDGMGLQVWCDFHHTRESAEKWAKNGVDQTMERYFTVSVLIHTA